MISIDNLSLRYGERLLFDEICANIGPRDRIGLVGSNGAGKSTFLKVLVGDIDPDGGAVARANYVTAGYLPQDGIVSAGRSLYAEVETAFEDVLAVRARLNEANAQLQTQDAQSEAYRETLEMIGELEHRLEDLDAFRLRAKIERVLAGLGFRPEDMTRDTSEFSGGWQMRIALAKLLLREPSLLLLDEPTNHLDLDSLRWLESYLQRYDGSLVIVSHDRAFLDALCSRTFALSMGRLEVYAGNYTFFERESRARRELQEKAFRNQQKALAKTQEFIDRFRYKATKAAQVQSRIKALEKIEVIELEDEEDQIGFSFPEPPPSGQVVLQLEGVTKSYGAISLFNGLDLRIEKGDRIAVVGVNGAGKSTLMRLLAGTEPPTTGLRRVGHNVALSYFAQHQAQELDPTREVIETLEDVASGDGRTRLRTILGAFLFRGDDVFKKVSVLSGGERNRLALARMLLRPFNCLIMDEPTNHLDMRSKEVLQRALLQYPGTFVIVSHDRAFLEPLVNKVLEIKPGGRAALQPGKLSEYLWRLDQLQKQQPGALRTETNESASAECGPVSAKERRQRTAEKNRELRPLRQQASRLETEIGDNEARVKEFEVAMTDPAFFKRGDRTKEDMEAYEALKAKVEQAYRDWEALHNKIAEIEAADWP